MKKFLSILFALMLVIVLIACDNGAGETETTGATNDTNNVDTETANEVSDTEGGADTADEPRLRIAFGYGDWESALGIQFQASLEYLATSFNFEPVFFLLGGGEDGIAAVESLLAGGDIDGIITSASWSVPMMLTADRHGVPVVSAAQFPPEAEIEGIAQFDNWIGGVTDNEFWAGYHTMRGLYESGSRNVTWSGLTAGFSQGHDDRTRGAMQFISENPDMNMLADSFTMGQWHGDVTTFVALFPELDGMAFTSLNDGVYNALEVEGRADGSIRLAGTDIASMTGDMFQRDIQVWGAGGQYGTPMIGFALLYNYIRDGVRIISDTTVPIERNYLEVTSYDEFQLYMELTSIPLYSADDIRQFIHRYNPNVTIEDFIRDGQEFSLESVRARRG